MATFESRCRKQFENAFRRNTHQRSCQECRRIAGDASRLVHEEDGDAITGESSSDQPDQPDQAMETSEDTKDYSAFDTEQKLITELEESIEDDGGVDKIIVSALDDGNPWIRALVSELLHNWPTKACFPEINDVEPPSYFFDEKGSIQPPLKWCRLRPVLSKLYIGFVRFNDGISAEMWLRAGENRASYIDVSVIISMRAKKAFSTTRMRIGLTTPEYGRKEVWSENIPVKNGTQEKGQLYRAPEKKGSNANQNMLDTETLIEEIVSKKVVRSIKKAREFWTQHFGAPKSNPVDKKTAKVDKPKS
ncbi:hypothetical protein IQ07DRAFT_675855 [Pyrenochaeta sp. DS3sAY3a]|nr:hypothetical protein IQ07DRAFT_675855 [Pyrenochaeta sp. DS3sAY3a]